MHVWQHLKHDQSQQKHGKEANKAGDVTVAEFKHAQSPEVPLGVSHVHPNQACVPEHVQGMNGWNDQQQRSSALLP